MNNCFDFTALRLTHSANSRLLTDTQGNTMLEISSSGTPLMVFYYRSLTEASILKLQEALATQLGSIYDRDLTTRDINSILPIVHIEALPQIDTWDIQSALQEAAFWCSPTIRLVVDVKNINICSVSIVSMGSAPVAYLSLRDADIQNPRVMELILDLRRKLRSRQLVRIENRQRKKMSCWYVPAHEEL